VRLVRREHTIRICNKECIPENVFGAQCTWRRWTQESESSVIMQWWLIHRISWVLVVVSNGWMNNMARKRDSRADPHRPRRRRRVMVWTYHERIGVLVMNGGSLQVRQYLRVMEKEGPATPITRRFVLLSFCRYLQVCRHRIKIRLDKIILKR